MNMSRQLTFSTALLLLLSLLNGCTAPPIAIVSTSASAQSPVAVFEAFNAAVNKHDVDAALALFSPNATVQLPNQPPPNVYKGTAEIRQWLEGDAARNIHVAAENLQTQGNKLTGISKVEIDELRPLGIVLIGTDEVIIEQGKITAFSFVLSDETLAKLQSLPTPVPTTAK